MRCARLASRCSTNWGRPAGRRNSAPHSSGACPQCPAVQSNPPRLHLSPFTKSARPGRYEVRLHLAFAGFPATPTCSTPWALTLIPSASRPCPWTPSSAMACLRTTTATAAATARAAPSSAHAGLRRRAAQLMVITRRRIPGIRQAPSTRRSPCIRQAPSTRRSPGIRQGPSLEAAASIRRRTGRRTGRRSPGQEGG